MLIPRGTRIHLAREHADFRKSIDGLSGLVRTGFEDDPSSGHVPGDPALLRRYALELQTQLRAEQERAGLYKREYEKLARELFGRRSERVDGQDEAQLVLFSTVEAPPTAATPGTEKPFTPKKRRGGGGRNKLPPHLARIEVTSDDAGPTTCDCCGGDLVEIGEDRSERLEKLPAQHQVLVVVRKKRACPKCPSAGVVMQPAPPFGLAVRSTQTASSPRSSSTSKPTTSRSDARSPA